MLTAKHVRQPQVYQQDEHPKASRSRSNRQCGKPTTTQRLWNTHIQLHEAICYSEAIRVHELLLPGQPAQLLLDGQQQPSKVKA